MHEGFSFRQWATVWLVAAVLILTSAIGFAVLFSLDGRSIPLGIWALLAMTLFCFGNSRRWHRKAVDNGQ